MKRTDWTQDLVRFGNERKWRQLPSRRALRLFAVATNSERRTGFSADKALRCGYAALAAATPDERDSITKWEDVLRLQAKQAEERKALLEKTRAKFAAEMSAMSDDSGWILLAGEDTTVVANGILSHVEGSLRGVLRQRRDSYSGRGCWIILAPDGRQYSSGTFTKDMVC